VGYLLDPSGKPIAGSPVTAVDALHSLGRQVLSNDSGLYRFPELPAAAYEISAIAPGFEKVTVRNIKVEVNAQLRIDLHLPIAAIKQAVLVTSAAERAQTESSELGMVLDQQTIESLP